MDYDLAVIGAGWAGFNAAIRARDLGLKVALIEKGQLGGTCLNRGCIPTKSLIQSAKIYTLAQKSAHFGIETQPAKINFPAIQARKDKIIQQLRQGMLSLAKGIELINKEARFISPDTLQIGQGEKLTAKNILIATGSRPIELKALKFQPGKVISSDELLNLQEIPASLLIIGGGVIGCEFAGLFATLGSKVTVVEKMPQLLPGEDREIARRLEGVFKKKGIEVRLDTDATTLDLDNYALSLLCIGRQPDIQGLGLETISLTLDKNRIAVDDYLRTSVPGVYAAGDCTGRFMLAHFAAYQGRLVAENLASPSAAKKGDNSDIPSCIFTDPEIASVGLNEEKAGDKGREIKISRFDFMGSGMARILDETTGFVKIISDKNTEEILGASIMGPRATELIGILTLARTNRLKLGQLEDTVFAHPTLSESIGEAVKEGHGI